MCCHNVARSSKECLVLSFYSHAAHSLTHSKCCVRTQLKSSRIFQVLSISVACLLGYVFSLLFAARTRSLILSYPHQLARAISIKSLLRVHSSVIIATDSYFFSFFSFVSFFSLRSSDVTYFRR